ncbi:3-oxo-5-alpha-steroid 4-dehydrogenase 1 [Reticulomyxa filosa]|uniref:3-oxo-5alpha-steroid 4-dehydrogenase (NADP(+)) n=1 Tax=Reticulomyxa filosa TaxID=46433 RepID=X6N9Q5_RETFI|nr:3-oxo-5-alpha-steroid 4-dehydrogenase 1 [Reticulomyxa filosa]|eukprot:ETO22469.1 3-oxo-5-alpha-steroid 4-dehydrogenase 1 [Reticulomyxa filosa]
MDAISWLEFFRESFFFTLKFEKSSRQQVGSTCYILISTVVIFLELVVGFAAPYGKFYSSNSLGKCPVPPRLAWFLQELPSFAVSGYFLVQSLQKKIITKLCDITTQKDVSWINRGLLSLMVFHYFNRTFIYSFRIKGGKPTAFMACALAAVFTAINGYLQSLCLIQFNEYQIHNTSEPRLFIGVALFVIGFFINFHSDNILRNLRKPGEKDYKIPRGGFFEYVTNAHYFGENLEWLGFGIAGNNVGGYVFALFTFANLFPRAAQSHQWYLKKFDNYPKNRKIYIPFLLTCVIAFVRPCPNILTDFKSQNNKQIFKIISTITFYFSDPAVVNFEVSNFLNRFCINS